MVQMGLVLQEEHLNSFPWMIANERMKAPSIAEHSIPWQAILTSAVEKSYLSGNTEALCKLESIIVVPANPSTGDTAHTTASKQNELYQQKNIFADITIYNRAFAHIAMLGRDMIFFTFLTNIVMHQNF